MSQHYTKTESGREVLYGLDEPTGGFFFTEFFLDEEIDIENDYDVASSKDGLTLTELVKELNNLNVEYFVELLLNDYKHFQNPSPLQIHVGKMFGRDVLAMLERVHQDMQLNYIVQ